MRKQNLVDKYKKAYFSAHGTKCKDLDLGEWSNEQLKNGVNALNFINDKK